MLNGPTNETWIEPWVSQLRNLGVRLRLGHTVANLDFHRGRISGVQLHGPRGRHTAQADWYVCALPVEHALRLWSREMLAADPRLARVRALETDWMNGLKLFLRENKPIARGFVAYGDGSWAMSSLNQAQFWPSDFASTYGDGRVLDSLSVIIANWHAPGAIYGKPAQQCTPVQVVHEVWEQIKRAVNKPGEPPKLTDDLLVSWNIDPGMSFHAGRFVNGDPLTVPVAGTRPARPPAALAIPNLMLAGDYVQVDALLGTMEAANEAGRLAANAVLQRAGSHAPRVEVFLPFRPPEWEPLKRVDRQRYEQGQRNLFDTDLTLDRLNSLLNQITSLVGIDIP